MKCKYAARFEILIGDTRKTCLIDTDVRYIRDVLNRYRYKSIARFVSPIQVSRYCPSLHIPTHFAVNKIVILSRNLDQNMPKTDYFLEKKK